MTLSLSIRSSGQIDPLIGNSILEDNNPVLAKQIRAEAKSVLTPQLRERLFTCIWDATDKSGTYIPYDFDVKELNVNFSKGKIYYQVNGRWLSCNLTQFPELQKVRGSFLKFEDALRRKNRVNEIPTPSTKSDLPQREKNSIIPISRLADVSDFSNAALVLFRKSCSLAKRHLGAHVSWNRQLMECNLSDIALNAVNNACCLYDSVKEKKYAKQHGDRAQQNFMNVMQVKQTSKLYGCAFSGAAVAVEMKAGKTMSFNVLDGLGFGLGAFASSIKIACGGYNWYKSNKLLNEFNLYRNYSNVTSTLSFLKRQITVTKEEIEQIKEKFAKYENFGVAELQREIANLECTKRERFLRRAGRSALECLDKGSLETLITGIQCGKKEQLNNAKILIANVEKLIKKKKRELLLGEIILGLLTLAVQIALYITGIPVWLDLIALIVNIIIVAIQGYKAMRNIYSWHKQKKSRSAMAHNSGLNSAMDGSLAVAD